MKLKNEILYINKLPLRFLFFSQVIIGFLLLILFVFLLISGIYLDIWTFAGPLLGLAMLITGLTVSKIKNINVESTNQNIVINKESLFKKDVIRIKPSELKVELKAANGKKEIFLIKIKIVIYKNENEVEKIESGFLSLNNSKIQRLYEDLKLIMNAPS